ncbi:hypothetical protein BGX27_004704 [Mortierella sp. AM989]|nr:hypothetical protein BGX27_004704 [Mortierella sp. AM989]
MSSTNAKHRVSPSGNPFKRNDPHSSSNNANAIMVNSDIMILNRQETPSEYEDDNYQTASSGRSDSSHPSITESLSLEQLPLPPSQPHVHSSVSGSNKESSAWHSPVTDSESHPYSLYQNKNSQNYSTPSSPTAHSPPTGPYRPSQHMATSGSSSYQYQQHSHNPNDTNNNNVNNPSNDHEMQERGRRQQRQQQQKARSPTLSSTSSALTSRTIDGTITRSGSIDKKNSPPPPVPKYRATNSNKNSFDSKNNNSRSSVYKPSSHEATAAKRISGGLSSLLGRFKSGEPVPSLTTDTPDIQSASGSKNSLVYDKYQHHSRAHLKDHEHSKTGVPGKNGEEPETDMFNFVHIMLNMPEEPTWKQVIIKLLKVLAVMTVSYFALMSLYFAAEFQSHSRMSNFDILVVDLDQGIIGINYLDFTRQLNNQPYQPNWLIETAERYPNMTVIKEQVMNGNYWGAVVVQANASSTLNRAFAIPLPDYDPTKAFAFIYDGGRDPLVVKPYIVATMYTQFLLFTKFFNPAWVKFILAYSESKNLTVTVLQNAPQVLGTPVAFEEFDLHPLTASIITSATSVAYIWIFLVAGGSTYLVTHLIQPMTRRASVLKTMIFMLLPLFLFLVTLSMAYSLLLLTFGVPFADGAPQFFKLFAGMLLLQCSVAALVLFLIFLIPVVFIPSITITFVILNVIAVFNPVELVPIFYKWVYAMPFLNAVQISRYVLMGSYNRLKYNIPVLSVWIMIPVILLPFAIMKQKRLAKEAEISEKEERLEEEFRSRKQGQMRLQLVNQDTDQEFSDEHKIEDLKVHTSNTKGTGVAQGQRHFADDNLDTHKKHDRISNSVSTGMLSSEPSGVADTQYSAP